MCLPKIPSAQVGAGAGRSGEVLVLAAAAGSRPAVQPVARLLIVLLRLVYLGVRNMFALLLLLPVSGRKDMEILALRHQVMILQRQLGTTRPRLSLGDRVLLAALLHCLPRDLPGRFRLLVRPDTVLRWHRDLLAPRRAARSRPASPCVGSVGESAGALPGKHVFVLRGGHR